LRALRSHTIGGPETLVLDEIADPLPGPGEVIIAVMACAINFPDTLVIRDLYQFKPPRPFAPGGEVSGVIAAVGEGVSRWKPGDRVAAIMISGGLAEKIAISENRVFALPDAVSFDTGAALLLTYGTTIHALKDRGHLQPGDTLLVLGASGGVGLAATELGKAMGARVVAGVSSAAKAAAARDAGADECVIYGHAPFDRAQSKALTDSLKAACGPEGAAVIYDGVGGDYSEAALRAIGWGGRYLVVGFPAGIARIPLNLTLLKACDICGVFFGAFVEREREATAVHVAELFRLIQAGRISPRVTRTFPLRRGGEAIALLESREAIGKLVVRMTEA
jgi:NADPH:quinone reductase